MVKDLAVAGEPRGERVSPKEPTHPTDWLREDIRDMRRDMGEKIDALADSVRETCSKLDRHLSDPRAHLGPDSSTSIMPPSRRRAAGFAQAARTFGPFFLAAALGLLGLGAYFGSGGESDATAKAIRATSDQMSRLTREVETLRAAVDAGEQ